MAPLQCRRKHLVILVLLKWMPIAGAFITAILALLGRVKKVLEGMDKTLGEIRGDLNRLTPVLEGTLQGM